MKYINILYLIQASFLVVGQDLPSSRILTGDPIQYPGAKAPAPPNTLTSRDPWRLQLQEGSPLSGAPGQRLNIQVVLSNYERTERSFRIDVREDGQSTSFIESVSVATLRVPSGEEKVLTLNLRISDRVSIGHRGIIQVTAVALDPSGSNRIVNPTNPGAGSNFVQMDISFLVSEFTDDTQGPIISNPSTPIESQCMDVEDCTSEYWTAIYHIRDTDSGIRSIETDPLLIPGSGSMEYLHNPFILGDPLQEVRLVLKGLCCEKELNIIVKDAQGNEEIRTLNPEETGLTGIEIGVIVVSVLILLILLIAGIVLLIIRRKRAANLEEIRRGFS